MDAVDIVPLVVYVYGKPEPQGSKSGWVTKSGKVAMREAVKGTKPWRAEVTAAVCDALATRRAANGGEWVPWPNVGIDAEYFFRRPASAPRRLRPNVKPDLDKLVRAVFDALKTGGALRDDATVVEHHAAKYYASAGRATGVSIVVAPVDTDSPHLPLPEHVNYLTT